MAPKPLISILVGFFDAEQFIEESIVSVLGQTLDDWELLLVDDGSSDGGGAIARRYASEQPNRIFYLTHPGYRNRGVCASRNLALQNARGRLVAILDADDVWFPEKLEQQVNILSANPRAGMVFGKSRYWRSWTKARTGIGKDFTPELGIEADVIHDPPSLLKRCHPLGRATAPCPSDLLIRHEVITEAGGFEEAFTGVYQLYEDQAFLAKIYLSTPVYASSASWTQYRLHANSCCYRVESSGAEPEVRGYYLNWLEEYLRTSRCHDPDVYSALRRAQMLSRHRWLNRLVAAPRTFGDVIKRAMSRIHRGIGWSR